VKRDETKKKAPGMIGGHQGPQKGGFTRRRTPPIVPFIKPLNASKPSLWDGRALLQGPRGKGRAAFAPPILSQVTKPLPDPILLSCKYYAKTRNMKVFPSFWHS